MKTISLLVRDDESVTIDGVSLAELRPRADRTDLEEWNVRHDTPAEVSIAAACHEANRQYCRTLGDYSQLPWSATAGEFRASCIEGVRNIASGDVKSAEESHARWMAKRVDDGWTYGPQKSLEAKTHPNLVPFAELPPAQRKKDRLFFAIATALLAVE